MSAWKKNEEDIEIKIGFNQVQFGVIDSNDYDEI
jgi:hypothetical protein